MNEATIGDIKSKINLAVNITCIDGCLIAGGLHEFNEVDLTLKIINKAGLKKIMEAGKNHGNGRIQNIISNPMYYCIVLFKDVRIVV